MELSKKGELGGGTIGFIMRIVVLIIIITKVALPIILGI